MPAALVVLNVKLVNPLEAVAVNVMGETPTFTGEAGVNVTVWLWTLMTTLALAEALE